MKEVLVLIGSPRKNGNSVFITKLLDEKLRKSHYNLVSYQLYDYDIAPCTDCRVCKKGNLVCKVDDGMQELYPKIESADIVVFATPIYWFGPSGKTKLLIDRLRPYFGNKKLEGKKGALLLPSGSGSSDSDLTIEQFRRTFMALGMKFLGAVTTTGFNIKDVEKDIYLEGAIEKLIERMEEVL